MTPDSLLLDRPVTGSVTRSMRPATPRPRNATYLDYAPARTTPRKARGQTRFFLSLCHGVTPTAADAAELVVSELVTNACAASAADSTVSLSLRHFDRHLLIEVIDSSPEPPRLGDPSPDSFDGRGLLIVGEYSTTWGYFRLHDGRKAVYAILPLP